MLYKIYLNQAVCTHVDDMASPRGDIAISSCWIMKQDRWIKHRNDIELYTCTNYVQKSRHKTSRLSREIRILIVLSVKGTSINNKIPILFFFLF